MVAACSGDFGTNKNNRSNNHNGSKLLREKPRGGKRNERRTLRDPPQRRDTSWAIKFGIVRDPSRPHSTRWVTHKERESSFAYRRRGKAFSSLRCETVIQNKNVNIIVNVDPQEVAKELWKVIEARLNSTGHPTHAWNAIKDLEKVVAPLVMPGRRSLTQPSAYHLATEFDQIARRALTRDTPGLNLMDQEIMIRDIVAEMMVSLKMIQSKIEEASFNHFGLRTEATPNRRMYEPITTVSDDEHNDYVNVKIKMRKQDILDVFH
ncbi:PREDICTED: uncharacterized protein LOC106749310 [Dinoponera quadriceps]|uniref:Uncharacterized protein LOC106749310 n=1 Tax=Dinoponera quadriceps TaxID=609295 RepID=A0A6P3Y1Q5_DINQU|nr:PREDICTED: uncharacterized protein LOC106749310 [Dinoponera quadriceps]